MPGSFSSQRKSRICPIDPKSGPRTIAWCATGAGNLLILVLMAQTTDDPGTIVRSPLVSPIGRQSTQYLRSPPNDGQPPSPPARSKHQFASPQSPSSSSPRHEMLSGPIHKPSGSEAEIPRNVLADPS